MRLRGLQLDFRVREMYETYEAMKRIVAGEADAMVESMMVEREREFFSQLRDSVDITNLKIAGHSMGGGTVFRVLQTAPPDGYTPMPVAHAVCLDPWLPPFEFADERPETRQAFPPCLSINSQEYTEWLPHFTQVVHASRAMGASFVTVPGMTREYESTCWLTADGADESFSDAEVIGSMSIARARRQLRTCHRLTMSLFSDALDENEYVKCFPEDHGAPARTPRGKLVAHDEVLIHILSVKGVV
jgi:platelet-activating factor acetylhydrolase